jgi:hypothetical protein
VRGIAARGHTHYEIPNPLLLRVDPPRIEDGYRTHAGAEHSSELEAKLASWLDERRQVAGAAFFVLAFSDAVDNDPTSSVGERAHVRREAVPMLEAVVEQSFEVEVVRLRNLGLRQVPQVGFSQVVDATPK